MSRLLLAAVLILGFAAPAFAHGDDQLIVSITPTHLDTTLGDTFDVQVAVTNRSAAPVDGVAVHIDITDPSLEGSVDPEDWTATLTQAAGTISPGDTATSTWSLQPISGGRFTLYAVALHPGSSDVATSQAVELTVAEQRALNPEGVLPIAIAGPVLIGGLMVMRWRARRAPAAT